MSIDAIGGEVSLIDFPWKLKKAPSITLGAIFLLTWAGQTGKYVDVAGIEPGSSPTASGRSFLFTMGIQLQVEKSDL